MSIRKIKAHKAQVNDEYISIETRSYKTIGAMVGCFTGLLFGGILSQGQPGETMLVSIIIGGISGLFLGALTAPGKVIREIPSVDLVEIKRYDYKDKVTVVLDDERTKKRQAVSSNADM